MPSPVSQPLLGELSSEGTPRPGETSWRRSTVFPMKLLCCCFLVFGLLALIRPCWVRRAPLRQAPILMASEVPKCHFANINYLGMAYDMFRGMPQPWQTPDDNGEVVDPGWRVRAIFEVSTDRGHDSEDGECLVPEGASVTREEACSFQTESTEVATGYEFQQLLKKRFQDKSSLDGGSKAAVDIYGLHRDILGISGGSGAFFSSSREFRHIQKGTSRHHYAVAAATCTVYHAVLDDRPKRLSDAFRADVKRLPSYLANDTHGYYKRFVDDWGTHYSRKIRMGARVSQLVEFDQVAFNEAKRKGFNSLKGSSSSQRISLLGGLFQFGHDEGHRQSSSTSRYVDKFFNKKSYRAFSACYGAKGECPQQVGEDGWRAAAGQDPMPLFASFESILALLTSEYFRGDREIDNKRRSLAEEVKRIYCQDVPGCAVVAPELYTTETTQLPDFRFIVKSTAVMTQDLYVVEMYASTHWTYSQHSGMSLYDDYFKDFSQHPNKLVRFDKDSGEWVTVGSLNVAAICDFAMAASSQRVYVIGGLKEAWSASGAVWEISPQPPYAASKFASVAPRFGAAAAVLDDVWLYVAGGGHWPPGHSDWDSTATVEAVNLHTGRIVRKPALKMARTWPAVATHAGVIYVAGGLSKSNSRAAVTKSVEWFDTRSASRSWMQMPSLNIARAGAGMVAAAGQLIIFGGFTIAAGAFQARDTVEYLPICQNPTISKENSGSFTSISCTNR
ncbi:ivns1abpa [Symbiodinium sp. KB8]|nr:ivns1abpa [Symbiodinium sp. KB8]